MQEIKDEDRIIGKICRGEISITNRDIKNLANADLDEAHEENFRKLAQEINETLDRNQQLRQEMKEKLEFAENSDFIVKRTLSQFDNRIDDLKIQYNKKKFTPAWKLVLGTLLTLILGMGLPLVASIFSSSLWVLGTITLVGFFTGVGIDVGLAVKSQDKCEKIKEQIKNLEQDRLEFIEASEYDSSKTQENEVKSNIINYIYKERRNETHTEEDLNSNL